MSATIACALETTNYTHRIIHNQSHRRRVLTGLLCGIRALMVPGHNASRSTLHSTNNASQPAHALVPHITSPPHVSYNTFQQTYRDAGAEEADRARRGEEPGVPNERQRPTGHCMARRQQQEHVNNNNRLESNRERQETTCNATPSYTTDISQS
jgi:hypothetical protein